MRGTAASKAAEYENADDQSTKVSFRMEKPMVIEAMLSYVPRGVSILYSAPKKKKILPTIKFTLSNILIINKY